MTMKWRIQLGRMKRPSRNAKNGDERRTRLTKHQQLMHGVSGMIRTRGETGSDEGRPLNPLAFLELLSVLLPTVP